MTRRDVHGRVLGVLLGVLTFFSASCEGVASLDAADAGGAVDCSSAGGGAADAGSPADVGASDGGTSDGGTSDGGTSDGGTSDGGTSDGGTSDGGTSDGGTSDGGGVGVADAGVTPSEQIATLLRLVLDAGLAAPVTLEGPLVTYLKPAVPDAGSADPAGFFLQADPTGPAVFVALDPATLPGGPFVVGDSVTLVATAAQRLGGPNRPISITAVSSATKRSGGNAVSGLVQAVSGADFTDAGTVDALECELISLGGTVASDITTRGNGFTLQALGTAGTPDAGHLWLRLPAALGETEDLTPGCTVTTGAIPMWRFGATGEPSPFDARELTSVRCPAPRLALANAATSTTVKALFTRNLAGATVRPAAFTITLADGGAGLTVSDAGLTGPREVTLQTSRQTNDMGYTLAVAPSVSDTRGTTMDPTASRADFRGLGAGVCRPAVVMSQFYAGGARPASTYNQKYLELHNRSTAPVAVSGWSVQYMRASTGPWAVAPIPDGGYVIAPGGFLLIGLGQPAHDGGTLPRTPDVTVAGFVPTTDAGHLALVPNATPLVGCPTSGFVDLLGYGVAVCPLGASAAPAGSKKDAEFRSDLVGATPACVDTGVNGNDFVLGPPAPRASDAGVSSCTCP